MSDSTTRGGWVYFIQHGGEDGPIKIGTTIGNPYSRMRTLQTGAPEELRLLAAAPGDARVEGELHERFAALRVRDNGEWFRSDAALLGFIAGVRWVHRDAQPEDDDASELEEMVDGFHGLTEGQLQQIERLISALIQRHRLFSAHRVCKNTVGRDATVLDEIRDAIEWTRIHMTHEEPEIVERALGDSPVIERTISELESWLGPASED